MDTSEFDSKNEQMLQDEKALIEKMENLCEPIANSYVTLLSKVFPEMMRKEVVSKPDIIQKLGREKLSIIKSESDELISELPSICLDTLKDASYWMHKTKTREDFGTLRFGEESRLLTPLRNRLTSYLGELLNKHGLITTDRNSEWGIRNSGSVYAKHKYDWNSKEEIAIRDIDKLYRQLSEELAYLTGQRRHLEKLKQEFIATSMWDEA
jgi:hypothetical protein